MSCELVAYLLHYNISVLFCSDFFSPSFDCLSVSFFVCCFWRYFVFTSAVQCSLCMYHRNCWCCTTFHQTIKYYIIYKHFSFEEAEWKRRLGDEMHSASRIIFRLKWFKIFCRFSLTISILACSTHLHCVSSYGRSEFIFYCVQHNRFHIFCVRI